MEVPTVEAPILGSIILKAPVMESNTLEAPVVESNTLEAPVVDPTNPVIGAEASHTPGNQKRRCGRIQDAIQAPVPVSIVTITFPHPVVVTLSATKAAKSDLVDEDGFRRVVHRKSPANKKSPKLAPSPVNLRHLQ